MENKNVNLSNSARAILDSPSASLTVPASYKLLTTSKILRFGITLNHPRTVAFLKKTSEQQKKMYLKMWYAIKNQISLGMRSEEHHFEYCQDGQIHMHIAAVYETEKAGVIIGMISDIAKAIHNCFPKKYSKYVVSCLYSNYMRYRHAGICVQYYESEEIFYTKWIQYIRKYNN